MNKIKEYRMIFKFDNRITMLQNTMIGINRLLPKVNYASIESVYITVALGTLGVNCLVSSAESYMFNKGNMFKMLTDGCYYGNLFIGMMISVVWPVTLPLYIIDTAHKMHNNFTK